MTRAARRRRLQRHPAPAVDLDPVLHAERHPEQRAEFVERERARAEAPPGAPLGEHVLEAVAASARRSLARWHRGHRGRRQRDAYGRGRDRLLQMRRRRRIEGPLLQRAIRLRARRERRRLWSRDESTIAAGVHDFHASSAAVRPPSARSCSSRSIRPCVTSASSRSSINAGGIFFSRACSAAARLPVRQRVEHFQDDRRGFGLLSPQRSFRAGARRPANSRSAPGIGDKRESRLCGARRVVVESIGARHAP